MIYPLIFSLFTNSVFFDVFYAAICVNVCCLHHYNILFLYLNVYFIIYILCSLLLSNYCNLDIFYRIVSFALIRAMSQHNIENLTEFIEINKLMGNKEW